MRDVDAMIAVLREGAEDPTGRILAPFTSDNIESYHQVELLADCGLVEWVSDHVARVTNTGYDFVQAIDRKEGFREQLQHYLDLGLPIVNAISNVMAWLSDSGS